METTAEPEPTELIKMEPNEASVSEVSEVC